MQALRVFQNATEQGEPFGPVRIRAAVTSETASSAPA